MLNLRDVAHQLDLGIDDARTMGKKRRQATHADVAIFVDGAADDRAAVLPEPARIIRSTAEEGDTKWCTADDHGGVLIAAGRCRREHGPGERQDFGSADIDERGAVGERGEGAWRKAFEDIALERDGGAAGDLVEQSRR